MDFALSFLMSNRSLLVFRYFLAESAKGQPFARFNNRS